MSDAIGIMKIIPWIKTVLQNFLSVIEPPDSRLIVLLFWGVGIYLFANYGNLDNFTIGLWTVGAYIFYTLADPSMGSDADES